MEHHNMPGFLVYVFLGLNVIAFDIGTFIGTTIEKKDTKTIVKDSP